MLFQAIEKFLSPARLAPYKLATRGDEQKALQLYIDNLRIGQEFHVLLSVFEITFRNALHTAIARQFRSSNWLLEQQTGFMQDRSVLQPRSRKSKVLEMVEIATVEYNKQRGHLPVQGAALIANLSFGFWTTLFTKKYYFLLKRASTNAFMHRPRGTTWTTISDRLQEVRHFRNRVYHHEPLCLNKQSGVELCFEELERMHDIIVELLEWISPVLPVWSKQIDGIPLLLQQLHLDYPAI